MPEAPPTFSESWYRIADQRISLRPGIKVQRQFFRGEKWFVLQNPFNNQYFRLAPAAYGFVSRLRPERTVQQAWEECLAKDPDQSPGQEEVLRLISQLYYANLLQYAAPADSSRLFERYQRRRTREKQAWWLNIMFARLPLLDPDAWLDHTRGLARALFSPVMAVVWLLVVGAGLKVIIENFGQFRQHSQGVLASGNLFLLYLGLVIVKTLHEFGHALACKRFGGEVHVMGVMLLIFTPTPYMDATASWGFRNRWQRILVGGAGMIVELFAAALATFLWVRTGPGTLHNLAYNMIFVASVSTVILNANPLLRYDGYYMLSDYLEIPNLYQRASLQIKYWAERYLYGLKKLPNPARSRREAAWLTIYAITSYIYRVIVFGGILLFVADRFLVLGILMAIACAISWVIFPIGRYVYYLAASPALERHRARAIAVSGGFALALLAILEWVPVPHHFRAPGIIDATEKVETANPSPGYLEAVLTAPGSVVTNGQPLVQLYNHELELQLAAARARQEETEALIRRSMQTNIANLKPLEQRLESAHKLLRRLESDQAALTVRAHLNGVWVAPEIRDYVGRWLARGSALGLIINPDAFYFTCTVAQTDVNQLFGRGIRRASVRLRGQAGTELPLGPLQIIPAAQNTLPSAALGWQAGGELPVSLSDPQGRQAAEPFFEVRAPVQSTPNVRLLQGRSGKIRFDLPPEPLLRQWFRRLFQLLQKRYQLT